MSSVRPGGDWLELRRFTAARIAQGRSGSGLPTQQVLEFGVAHALARDAVHTPLRTEWLVESLLRDGWDALAVSSQAPDRTAYLREPGLGRRLSEESRSPLARRGTATERRLCLVVADGLSAMAVESHAPPLLRALRPLLAGWELTPLCVATQGRVALGDEIGALLQAEAVVMLIGERPGLTVADSLGMYLTYAPRSGRTDAERNCISNIHGGGLDYETAARRLAGLLGGARALGASGVMLHEESEDEPPEIATSAER